MSMPKPNQVAVRDLVEEAKKRIVILIVCVVGLSYLMSLTSSSVWVNLPAAASLLIIFRYLSLDYEMKRKAAAYNNKSGSTSVQSSKKPTENPKAVAKFEWRAKVNSPVVEDAIDHFTRHLISEWVTDLWYSRLTPDKEGPEELVQIVNGVLGEISGRMRNINLIDFLIRDLVNLICTHLELFRAAISKIEKQHTDSLTIERRDTELKIVLAAEDKLHPALFSSEAEHKVLQHLMNGLMSVTFKSEDLQCSFFRYIVRELLACAVMRPVLNLANPRFINERIESVVINKTKANKGVDAAQGLSPIKEDESQTSSDHFSKCLDPSATGVELTQLKNGQSRNPEPSTERNVSDNLSRDPLLSMDTRSSRSWNSLPGNSQSNGDQGIQRYRSGGEWGDILDVVSRRKTQTLAPEHFENVWAKGKNYQKKDGENQSNERAPQHPSTGKSLKIDHMKATSGPKEHDTRLKLNTSKGGHINSGYSSQFTVENASVHTDKNGSTCSSVTSYKDDEDSHINRNMSESESNTSYTSEDDETSTVTGLDSPVTKVWDGKSIRNQAVSYVHHPLENVDSHSTKKRNKNHSRYPRSFRTQSGSKRSRSSDLKTNMWQEVERSSFLSGDGRDILGSPKPPVNSDGSSDDADFESLGRIYSGAAASSSSISKSESCSLAVNPLRSSSAVDSFYKLRCEVLGANIVKSGSRTFAVYSISVTDVNNNSWSIKRRFRHFEELHRRLKEFSEYNLHLPPKHFLSTGLDVATIQERCELLDKYLKKLMELPTVSESIELWDFLSVDSQTYVFSNSFSIMETLPVGLDAKSSEKTKISSNVSAPGSDSFLQTKNHAVANGSRPTVNSTPLSLPSKKNTRESRQSFDNSGSNADILPRKSAHSPNNLQKSVKGRDSSNEVSDVQHDTAETLPTEWVPPNLSVPILDLVDVIFQLQDGGWIRRQAFWVAKQVLQLGMGDALDDWLLEKILLLRKGSVIASGVTRVEQILWPDGIFLTKHPNRRPPTGPSQSSPNGHQSTPVSTPRMDDEQQREADRRAKFVYELMIDHAPPAIVGLVGKKEYEQCARDLYFFLQSSVCLKLLAFDLLEMLLLSAFPELDDVFKQVHEEKHRFGELVK
ncbi:phox domain-containing protein [Trifolium pratense]|uniref:Phox domain-containing protein n=1 Tax=Trifolium pratense TaxID=57577 RepID=A0A2K3NSL3_TRIPR|nr:phox domain-containing protein [Trifolium pratense]